MKKLELTNISKSYDHNHLAVADINLTIEPGEFFVLVGPSGCGKSTMLRMIAGLETITNGELKIGDKVANHLPPGKRDLSMVFQNYALYPHLTVEQNIVFGLHTKGLKKRDREARCFKVAKLLGLVEYLKRKPKQLSGGQRQRVALARAIASQSPICLMDEPLSNLDAKLRAQMRSEIRHLQRELGITLIYVTHDQVEAMTMADRMMILKDGRIQQIGSPLDIYNRPANRFVAEFIGTPPMNIAEVQYNELSKNFFIEGAGVLEEFPWEVTNITVPGPSCSLIGIRPEHVAISTEPASSNSLKGTIYNTEILGNETISEVELGHNRWSIRENGQLYREVEQAVYLHVPKQHLTLFNQAGDRLTNHEESKVGQKTERVSSR